MILIDIGDMGTLQLRCADDRKFCASCQKKKTHWLVGYGRYWNRRCFACMSAQERTALIEG